MSTKVIRSAGSLVTSDDDARLIQKVFTDGLFNTDLSAITVSAGATIQVPAIYGILQGRDFHIDTAPVTLPLNSTTQGYLVVHMDLSKPASERVCVMGYIQGEHTLVYENLNYGGTVAEMQIATYSSDGSTVTAVSPGFNKCLVDVNSTKFTNFTIEASKWSNDTYIYENDKITPDTNQTITPAIGITKDQYLAFGKAMIVDDGQRQGALTLRALNGAPKIDIPARIRFFDENSTIVA